MRRPPPAIAILGCIAVAMAQSAFAAPASPIVKIEDGRLSVNADRVPLVDLLTSISTRDARISFALQGDASRILVSDSFQGLPLARALGRVLSAHSHLLVERVSGRSDRRIEVILLGAGSDLHVVSVAGHSGTATAQQEESTELLLADAVSASSADERSAAAEAVAFRSGSQDGAADYADPLLAQMLSDPDEDVRARALDILKDTADELPFDALAQVAREDVSAARRIQALALLVERSENGESREPLAIALNDDNPQVRRRAQELMLDWHISPTED